jgi:hypothetical protein
MKEQFPSHWKPLNSPYGAVEFAADIAMLKLALHHKTIIWSFSLLKTNCFNSPLLLPLSLLLLCLLENKGKDL